MRKIDTHRKARLVSKPTIVIICGAPASGKTTLAHRLARDLRIPLLEKDLIKEAIADAVSPSDRDASRQIGAASMNVLFELAHSMLSRNVSTILESNFLAQFARNDLANLSPIATLLVVQCSAPVHVIEARYRNRASAGSRHAAHFDLDALPDLVDRLDRDEFNLTPLPYPSVIVDTTAGYDPEYPVLLERIRSALHP